MNNLYQEGGMMAPQQQGPDPQLKQIFQVLTEMGLIQMPFEEFAQLPQEQIQQLLMQAEQAQGQPQQEAPMQPQDPGMAAGAMPMEGGQPPMEGMQQPPMMQAGGLVKDIANAAIPTAVGAIGSTMLDNKKPDTTENMIGSALSNAGSMASTLSVFGPWGTAAGGVLGAAKGIFDANRQKDEYIKDLNERTKPRQVSQLGTSYNPEMGDGGDTLYEQMAVNNAKMGGVSDRFSGSFSESVSDAGPGIQPIPTVKEKMKFGGMATLNKLKLQMGGPTTQNNGSANADVEIEGGEAVFSQNGNADQASLYGGASASDSSSLGFMAEGAKHGQKNNAGSEGIPMEVGDSDGMYVGSKELGVDGRKASSKNPSVADRMKPYLKYAEKYENSKDKYSNNTNAMETVKKELEQIRIESEMGKAMTELEKLLKNRNSDNVMETHDALMDALKEYPGKDDILTTLTGSPAGGEKSVDSMMAQSEVAMGEGDPMQDPSANMAPEEAATAMQESGELNDPEVPNGDPGMAGMNISQSEPSMSGEDVNQMPKGKLGGLYKRFMNS